jgi:DNA helicase-2/ATP-dependent DNA helicase PcrA
MTFYADLHVHSKYSRATSRNCDLEHLALWARKKGIGIVATGDFTHPAWRAELKEKLVRAEPGLFRLRPDLERFVEERLPAACRSASTAVRFMLSVEISTIYKKLDRTRKIHHLIYTPDFESTDRVVDSLSRIGNLHSDGRPILGLDSRHLLEIALESGPDSYLVPAHIWTPWFAALGSKSGFDAIDDCYGDLAPHIFAVETGLSSDPPMNWRVSSLDRFRLVSNSDAHSPEKLGREVCVFDTELDYFALRHALETGHGYGGTLEFFPEEGKYHLDGHRSCDVRFSPAETRQHQGRCPVCGKPLTVGVMHRVEDLADRRTEEAPPPTAGPSRSLVPLPEMLSEIYRVGPKSKKISHHYENLLGRLGPELQLLTTLPLEDIRRASPSLVPEAVSRLRKQEVIRAAGYDGVYGTIRLFHDAELRRHDGGASLFGEAPPSPPAPSAVAEQAVIYRTVPQQPRHTVPVEASAASPTKVSTDSLAGLDADQRRAAEITRGPLLIVAGPGSGKTRTLAHRLVHLITEQAVPPAECLALTFTRRAADELRARLRSLLPDGWQALTVGTFHALALSILQANWNAAGLQRGFRLASDAERLRLLGDALGVSAKKARSQLSAISHAKRTRTTPTDGKLGAADAAYQHLLDTHNLLDFDDLVIRAADALASDPALQAAYRKRYRWVSIDEYQDVDEQQVRLLKHLVPADGNICAIGDPDQAIYGFRGADMRFFSEFQRDFPAAQVVRLSRNYRSDRNIVRLSSQLMATSSTRAVLEDAPSLITIHEAPTEKAEAEFIVQTLERSLGGHSFFSIDSGRSADAEGQDWAFSDFAVLYRTESQAAVLVEALQRSGMPFQQRSHDRLLDHPGVAGLTEAMRAQAGSLQAGSLGDRLEAAYTQLQQTASARSQADEAAHAYSLLKPIAQTRDYDLDGFLSELALESQIDSWDPRADRISLLTLHAAKGLEFPVVFIVGCEDGILPLRWGKSESAKLDAETDEERRVFYVGVTRAKTKLYLSRARKRRWRGKIRELPPSPYLAAIEDGLLERQRSQMTRKPRNTSQLELFS